jgi:hypothetical protein
MKPNKHEQRKSRKFLSHSENDDFFSRTDKNRSHIRRKEPYKREKKIFLDQSTWFC